METYIVRQPILNDKQTVVAYELLYKENGINATPDRQEAWVASAVEELLGKANDENFLDDKIAFVTFTPNLLMKNIPRMFPEKSLVIQIGDDSIVHPVAQKMIYRFKKQGYRIALKDFEFMPRFFGIMDAVDILKVDFSGLETQVINEKCGLYFQPFHAPANALQVLHNLTPEAEWAYYPIPTVDGSKPQIPVGSGVNCYWVVREGFQDPEAIIKMLNLYVDYQYGVYETEEELERVGKGMMEGKDGNLWKMSAVQAFTDFNNLERYHLMNDYLKNGTEPPLKYRSLAADIKSYLDNGDESKWWTNQVYGVGGCLGIIDQYKADDQYITDQYYGPKTETYTSSWGDLFSMEQTTFMEIITGQKTISEFDKFVEDWRRKGGDKITEEINAWYESVQ